MRPAEIPLAMLYVNGINTITRNAGKPSVQSSKSMLRIAPNMRAPTMIRTGDVAAFGTKDTNGAKNKQIRNNTPVVTAVKPVLATSPYTCRTFNKGRNCRSTEQCTSTNADSIDSHSFTKTWEFTRFRICNFSPL